MTSPSWASSVTRAFDSTRSSASGSGPGSGIPATIDKLSVDRGNAPLSGGRQPFDERDVRGEGSRALADRHRDRVQTGSWQCQLAPHLAAGRRLHVEDHLAAACRGPVQVGADHVGQVVLGAVDRRPKAAVEHLCHLGPQRDRVEGRHEDRELGVGGRHGRRRRRRRRRRVGRRGRARSSGRIGDRDGRRHRRSSSWSGRRRRGRVGNRPRQLVLEADDPARRDSERLGHEGELDRVVLRARAA